jgi:hypothetical protein
MRKLLKLGLPEEIWEFIDWLSGYFIKKTPAS